MKNSKEIEIKLTYKNKRSIINALSPKIKFLKKIYVEDCYYGFTDTKMKNSNNIIRIRTIDRNKYDLTFKSRVRNKNNVWFKKEITVEISSAREMEKILDCLGIKKYYEYINEKEYWVYENLGIVFAKYSKPAQLEFMEIEGETGEKIKQLAKKIANIAEPIDAGFFRIFDTANLKKRNK